MQIHNNHTLITRKESVFSSFYVFFFYYIQHHLLTHAQKYTQGCIGLIRLKDQCVFGRSAPCARSRALCD